LQKIASINCAKTLADFLKESICKASISQKNKRLEKTKDFIFINILIKIINLFKKF
jgi:hypothetical protein